MAELSQDEKDLIGFLRDAKPEVRKLALQHLVEWTTREEMRDRLRGSEVVENLVRLCGDTALGINTHVLTSLINLSQELPYAESMVDRRLCPRCVKAILDREEERRGLYVLLLCNLTRVERACEDLLQSGSALQGMLLRKLVSKFISGTDGDVAWLASVFTNITQIPTGRKLVLDRKGLVLKLLLPFAAPPDDDNDKNARVRRRGILGVVRNVASEHDEHEWLLGEDEDVDVDILPVLLEPLVGAGSLSEADRVGLPFSLLPLLDKRSAPEREAGIRQNCCEGLRFLARSEVGREALAERGVYPILRNLDLWEPEDDIKEVILDIVSVIHNLDEVPPNVAVQ